jgi:hypothetical protein
MTGRISPMHHLRATIGERLGFTVEERVTLPDVEESLDIGYAHYVASDTTLVGTADHDLALRIVREFNAINAQAGTPAYAYLQCVLGVVLSYSRALRRRRSDWNKAVEHAEAEYHRHMTSRRDGAIMYLPLQVAWNLASGASLALAGFLIGQVVSLVIPQAVAAKTGSFGPASLIGLLFLAAGIALKFYLQESRRTQVEDAYAVRIAEARDEFYIGRQTEYRLYRQRLVEAWKQYGGEDYPETLSYEHVMASDIKARDRQLARRGRNSKRLLRYARFTRRLILYVRWPTKPSA